MRKILSIIFGLVLLTVVIIMSCSKTIILNKAEQEQEQMPESKADTAAREVAVPAKDTTDTLHEITFEPTIISWEVIDINEP